ncbi:MAG: tetratricopeptide repeat protein, partial [Chloroflexi bacterium]|nr:tetratricopeptide repeat protein [Chloroflexota bacterium]
YNKKGEHDSAIQDFDRALKLSPDYALAYYNRACAYSLKGEVGSLSEDLKKAVSLNPEFLQDAKEDNDLAWARENIPEVRRLLGLDTDRNSLPPSYFLPPRGGGLMNGNPLTLSRLSRYRDRRTTPVILREPRFHWGDRRI